MIGTWVERSLDVGTRRITVSIETLDDALRERAAAHLAWATLEALLNAEAGDAWHSLVNDLLSRHVSLTVPDLSAQLDAVWWQETVGRALSAFVDHNQLAPGINRYLHAFHGIESPAAQHDGVRVLQ